LGNQAITICPYLWGAARPCAGEIWDGWSSYQTLENHLRLQIVDYLVFDPTMEYALHQPSGLSEVVSGQDPRWQLVLQVGDYRVYRHLPPG
jgi:hypothetical protein